MIPESAQTSEVPRSEPAAAPPPWPGQVRALGLELCGWAMRPRVRLTVTGVILVLAGGVFATSSMWTLPLLIVGALMIAVAWVGHRLDGRLAIEWGDAGTQLEFRAQIKAPEHAYPALPAPSAAPRVVASSPEPEPEDADVVEGESHTVEIEVAELKALIAAAGSAEASAAETEPGGLGTRPLWVAGGGAVAGGDARAAGAEH